MKSFNLTLVLVSISLFSSAVFAHVEDGFYKGKTNTGSECKMQSLGTSFEGGVAHPLNERVKIKFNNVEYILSHPSLVDIKTSTVSFNHDILQNVKPTQKGADAFIVNMIHSQKKEGPESFQFISHEWKSGAKVTAICKDLVFSETNFRR